MQCSDAAVVAAASIASRCKVEQKKKAERRNVFV